MGRVQLAELSVGRRTAVQISEPLTSVSLQGIIPADSLRKILAQLPDADEEEVDAMIADIDDDGNGEISFDGKYNCVLHIHTIIDERNS